MVILCKCISVDNIEWAEIEELFALYDILPFSFHDFNAWALMPSLLPHVSKHIWVSLDYDM